MPRCNRHSGNFTRSSANIDATNDVHLREIARRCRLADLRFDANPVGEAGRALLSER